MTRRHAIEAEAGFRSREVALALAQLEDLTRRLVADTAALGPAALEWQAAPGTNTIGMLLAHVAYWEAWWVHAVLERRPGPIEVRDVLGIDREEVGTPLPAGGRPPAALAGREVAWFHDLLTRARAHTYLVARSVSDAELDREVERTRPDGSVATYTIRWALYHVLEHLAGHYGQVNLLRRLHAQRSA